MKKISICTVALLMSILGFSQKQDKPGIIERDKKGIVTSARFPSSIEKTEVPQSANDFFIQYLEANRDDQFKKAAHQSKRVEFAHDHYDQFYKNVKVQGAGYNFHFKNGRMYFANGNYVKIKNLNPVPSINLDAAIDSFLKYKTIEKKDVRETKTELLIKDVGNDLQSSIKLVYRIYLVSNHPNNKEVGFVNAHTGEVVATEPRVLDLLGTFATRYSGSQQADTDPVTGGHRLFDNTRGATIHTQNLQNSTTDIASAIELTDNDNNWTAGEHAGNNNDMGLDVHWGLQQIYDHLSNTYGINSFDDSGWPIDAYVRYGTNFLERDNAFWDPSLNVLYFGQGENRFEPLAALDVVGHEFGHGITDFQVGWGFTGDQRAFHEGLSDVWGAIFEHRINPTAVWQIGDQVVINNPYLRNIQNPNDANADTQIAGTYQSTQYNNGNEYVRSGVMSHWFYVLVNGETGINGVNSSYSVSGVGMDVAEDLLIEAVFNNYLDNTTTYPAIRTAMLSAAEALYGECSAEYISTANAWNAVGVGTSAGGPISAKYTYGGSPTYVASGNFGIGVSSSSQTIYIELGNYGSSGSYSWSITSQSGSASVSFSGKTATMSLNAGAFRQITCQITTENCGVISISISAYNYGGSFRIASYPNPADETLTVSVLPTEENSPPSFADRIENSKIKLLNEAGKSVVTGSLKDKSCILDVSGIPPGRYFLHIDTPNEKIKEQIIIRH